MHLTMMAALGLAWLLRLVCKDSTGVGANAIHALVFLFPPATDNDGVSSCAWDRRDK